MNTVEFPIWARVLLTGLLVLMFGTVVGAFSDYALTGKRQHDFFVGVAWTLVILGALGFGFGTLLGVWS